MEELIEAALAHAKHLRQSAGGDDDYGARAAEKEAERWERMVGAARDELAGLLAPHRN
jgi:hypothetical protein